MAEEGVSPSGDNVTYIGYGGTLPLGWRVVLVLPGVSLLANAGISIAWFASTCLIERGCDINKVIWFVRFDYGSRILCGCLLGWLILSFSDVRKAPLSWASAILGVLVGLLTIPVMAFMVLIWLLCQHGFGILDYMQHWSDPLGFALIIFLWNGLFFVLYGFFLGLSESLLFWLLFRRRDHRIE